MAQVEDLEGMHSQLVRLRLWPVVREVVAIPLVAEELFQRVLELELAPPQEEQLE